MRGLAASLGGGIAIACALTLALAAPAHSSPARAAAPRTQRHRATSIRSGAVLAATPYMGWDSYLAFGATYSEASVLQEASTLIKLGLAKRGYDYVWLDVGWWQGQRRHGQIAVNRQQWPHGIRWLAATLHAEGLKLGVYTDAGRNGCGGARQGSYGHYKTDMNTFASWGVDAVKVDFCGGSEQRLNPELAYSEIHTAIEANKMRRPMLLSICDFLQPGSLLEGWPPVAWSAFGTWQYGPRIANSWRTEIDIGRPGHVTFSHVLRNLDADAAHPRAAGPGHWNDPDYLGPGQGMSAAQFRTQFSMWAMLAAPLMVSAKLQSLSPASLATLRNREAIAIDQDPAGIQGVLVSAEGEGEVWVKPLSDGSRAVALLNRGKTPITLSTSASAVGLPSAPRYSVRDIWAHRTSSTAGAISATVPRDSTVLLRVYPEY